MLEESREQLIVDIDRRLEDKIIEPRNAEILKRLIENAETLDDAQAIATLGTTWKRTGFHFDKRLETKDGKNDIKYFKKNEELSFSDGKGGIIHKLIIGDNYDALLNLLIEYRGKIDVIYIDPPYGKDSMGQFAKTNYENAVTRDNLLSMLYTRLVLAKQLLSPDGVIFCSIDDRNYAYFKCLFDEIFEEVNTDTLIWNTTAEGNSGNMKQVLRIRNTHEYIIIGYKNKKETYFKKLNEALENQKLQTTNLAKNNDQKKGDTNRIFEIINPINNRSWIDEWKFDKEKINELQQEGLLYFGKEGNNKPRLILPTDDRRTVYISSIVNKGSSTQGRKDFEEICEPKSFDNPKPVILITTLLSVIENKQCVVLDFFAGSGTSGQAVLELNKQDSGKRQFILCTLNEKTEVNPNGVAYDVTTKRLRRIMTGSCYDGTTDFDWIKKHEAYGGNLDVYEIAKVANFEKTTGKTAFDVIDETLYGKEKFKTLKEKIEWVCSNFDGTQKTIESDNEWLKRMGVE